jgi:hypothetical protein
MTKSTHRCSLPTPKSASAALPAQQHCSCSSSTQAMAERQLLDQCDRHC